MNLIRIVVIAALFIGCSAKKQQDVLPQAETTTINLPSIVCGSCAKTIQKAVSRVDGVKEVSVDVEKKTANVKFISVQTNLEAIETAITGAGYDANSKKRNANAYQKLDACCKIDG